MPPKTKTPSDVDAARSAAILGRPLTLPCGVTLPNRLVKAAMSELLADTRNRATAAHQTLYRAWAKDGPGLMLTGNVQIDRQHMEHAGNVVIQGKQNADQLTALRAWSTAAKRKARKFGCNSHTPAARLKGGSTTRLRRHPRCR